MLLYPVCYIETTWSLAHLKWHLSMFLAHFKYVMDVDSSPDLANRSEIVCFCLLCIISYFTDTD